MQRETEKDREEEHLQNIALSKGADYGARNDVHQKLSRGLHFAWSGVGRDSRLVERCRINMHA